MLRACVCTCLCGVRRMWSVIVCACIGPQQTETYCRRTSLTTYCGRYLYPSALLPPQQRSDLTWPDHEQQGVNQWGGIPVSRTVGRQCIFGQYALWVSFFYLQIENSLLSQAVVYEVNCSKECVCVCVGGRERERERIVMYMSSVSVT